MSITPDDIADALLDIDEDEVEKRLCESDCLLYSLVKAIVTVKCFNGDPRFLTSALDACMNEARRIQESLAAEEATKKNRQKLLGAEMKDSFDDYEWRTA